VTGRDEPVVTRPRLRPGLVTVMTERGLLISDTSRRILLSGSAARMLPRLVPLLDGQHDLAALCARSGAPRAEIERALALLEGHGMLRSTANGTPSSPLAQHVADYFSGAPGPRGGNLPRLLADLTVLISAPEAITRRIADDLRETGVGRVVVPIAGNELTGAAMSSLARESRCVAVVFDPPGEPAPLASVVDTLQGAGGCVLRCAAGPGWAEVGPVFRPGGSACVRCFRQGYREASGEGRSQAASWPSGSDQPGLVGLLAGLVTQRTLDLAADDGLPAAALLSRLRLGDRAMENYLVTPHVRCPRCGWHRVGSAATATAPAWEQAIMDYEWQSVMPPGWTVVQKPPSDRDHLANPEAAGHGGLPSPRRLDGHLPRRRLPEAKLPRLAADRTGPHRLDGPLIAAILRKLAEACGLNISLGDGAAAAIRDAGLELYLLPGSDLFGLPGSIFRYDPAAHQVIATSTRTASLASCWREAGLDPADLPAPADAAMLFFTGWTWSAVQAQPDPSYKLAHLHTGYAVAELSAMADAARLRVSLAPRWPDEFAGMLELRPGREVITAVAAITGAMEPQPCR
jgi:hypothetical protein